MKAKLMVNVQDEEGKRKMMVLVSKMGVDLIWMDMEKKIMTIKADVDIYGVMTKLKKHYTTNLLRYTDHVVPTFKLQKRVGKSSGSLKILVNDDTDKKNAMEIASKAGADYISIDMGKQQIWIMGDIDIFDIFNKFQKQYATELLDSHPPLAGAPKKSKPSACVIL